MTKEILRQFLEIRSSQDIKIGKKPDNNLSLNLIDLKDFQLNKFFYKQIGKKYNWKDRLIWTDKNWIDFISSKNLKTYVLKNNQDLVGYFELILHFEANEVEIAYLGLLAEYQNRKLGSFILSAAIKNSFLKKPKRVWVHTCSLDHKNALNNYISRGMKVFKTETVLY